MSERAQRKVTKVAEGVEEVEQDLASKLKQKPSQCAEGGFGVWRWGDVEMGAHLPLRICYFVEFCAVAGIAPYQFIPQVYCLLVGWMERHSNDLLCPTSSVQYVYDIRDYCFYTSSFPLKRVLTLTLDFSIAKLETKQDFYDSLSEEELQVGELVTTKNLQEAGLVAPHQSIDSLTMKDSVRDLFHGDPSDVKEAIVVIIAEEALKDAIRNEGTPRASTFKSGKMPFCVVRAPSLANLYCFDQSGFDPYFLRLDHRRYPINNYLDRVDDIIRSPNHLILPMHEVWVDNLIKMLYPGFFQYGSLLGREDITQFASGNPSYAKINDQLLTLQMGLVNKFICTIHKRSDEAREARCGHDKGKVVQPLMLE
uniref:Uncharacterized protein n=1 Tax=Cannabis sativa TaxID=3483 RepID=A0A803Q5T7_CANSA